MADETLAQVETVDTQNTQEAAEKTYTQAEFDRHMAGMRKSIESKFEKQFAELGDLEELRQLKTQAEQARLEQAKKRGEFDQILKEMAAKKDAEIQKRDAVIMEYKVNTPLLDAAAKNKSVNPNQVRQLLSSKVKLGEDGEVVVMDANGNARYDDSGNLFTVDALVSEFLDENPHFRQASAATTNTTSNYGTNLRPDTFDLASLDLTKAEHRKIYNEARVKGLV